MEEITILILSNLYWLGIAPAVAISTYYERKAKTQTDVAMAMIVMSGLLSWSTLLGYYTYNKLLRSE